MNAIKSLFAKIASFFKSKEEPAMTEVAATTTDQTAAASVTSAKITATSVLSTDTLKSLLITLGHDVEAEWDHLIALATKPTATPSTSVVAEPVAAA